MDRRTFLTSTALTSTALGIGLATSTPGLAGASPGRAPALTRARAVRATSLDQLRQAIAAARPGGTVVLANGTYAVPAGRPIAIQGKNGSSGASIVVQAESVGGVTLTGTQGFTFADSSWVTVSGFRFRQSSMIDLATSCHHLRLSRNDFQLADVSGVNWLMVRAEYSKVDRNHFHGKSTLGVFLCVEGPGTSGMSRGVHILRNHFSDHSFTGSNGGEPIRLGLSGRSLSEAGAIVEQNLFERANGDPEAISVKSSGNTIRDNTVRDSLGGIVLRHGSRSRVEGNFVLSGSNGIRIYGNDHLVVNNYVEKVSGAGIVLGSGSVRDDKPGDSPESRRGNDAPDRVTIALNTVLSCGTAIAGETMRTLPPLGCTIADNLLVGDSGRQLVEMPYQQGISWSGNLLWGAAGNGNLPASGFSRKDPLLAAGADGVRRLTAGSPAINAASRTYPTVARDVDGHPRSGKADVGADEYSTATPANRPLTSAEVGPKAP
ncbi:polysaccharide lyase 6 family protein [Kribbella sp. CA-293567]|uniref:polysaccharide lyase 6 family protein n=1 Tax=Kribbella sp. CA-293567 TaxID=3002436 RepID=UPI0022DE2497|nr:polysaccharide lyase 6 family protein [Kribbella sp. CA-293567]WBQ06685.1 polysaccharide lyase 6 family protein [Kribbella sp. CA-293567]